MYKRVIESITGMESKLSPSQIKIIFADGPITQNLLVSFWINDTCLLRGDYYHHMYDDFPKAHNFGVKHFDLTKKTYGENVTFTHGRRVKICLQ